MNTNTINFSAQQIQSALQALSAYQPEPFVKHEWVELVSQLSHSDDPVLRERMSREMEAIKQRDAHHTAF